MSDIPSPSTATLIALEQDTHNIQCIWFRNDTASQA